ncbi:PREDICTED: transmembrane protein 263-B-like [Branchiostoma belcheri]|uniref:Transmembrane protein 263-B-like n=1 Tax=Branchiostoma belcheri TaxID=7741 RepID=A0A6P4ZWX5_BRABE|nr:PREDICTED: transmembrane protein 263-B-like [Branchiostoma belcheri]KAI8499736.1 hypothetical protein Bbelb_227870 [Branchiostoma belcheri]
MRAEGGVEDHLVLRGKGSPTKVKTEEFMFEEEDDATRTVENVKEPAGDGQPPKDEKPGEQPGIVRKVGSGVYNTATGALGMGFSGIKWVAGTSYSVVTKVPSAGYGVVSSGVSSVTSRLPSVSIPLWRGKGKDKND